MDHALVDQTSDAFVGQWKRLVSTTNWEKGRIIHEWRESLQASGAPAAEFSDEAWSRRVGHVTPQHVGRLRRAYEQFGAVRDDYLGLYWSHFQAALDWDDAPLWLEGAVHSGWSVAEMRLQRRQALGIVAGDELPGDDAEPAEPWDEDAEVDAAEGELSASVDVVRDPQPSEAADDDDEPGYDRAQFDDEPPTAQHDEAAAVTAAAARPFAELPPLPADLNEAFEAYKLCILRHRLAGWQEITRDDMLASLDALRQLVLAPADV
jgi:hypothetical protein